MRLASFAEQSRLIPQAMEALRNLKPDLQDKIMEEGPIRENEGKNPIVVLMNRIKAVAQRAQKAAAEAKAKEKEQEQEREQEKEKEKEKEKEREQQREKEKEIESESNRQKEPEKE